MSPYRSNPGSTSGANRRNSRMLFLLGFACCVVILLVIGFRLLSHRDFIAATHSRNHAAPSFRKDEFGSGRIPDSDRRREIRKEERIGNVPKAFLGGATDLSSDAAAYLGITNEQSERISNALCTARDRVTNLALSKIRENPNGESRIDLNSLCFAIAPDSAGISADAARKMIAAAYTIPSMKIEGAEIEQDLRSELVSIIGHDGDIVTDEARQHREFMKFCENEVDLILLRHEGVSGYSVYLEFRVPETGKLTGGALIPFAAFNKRFGGFFAK